MNKFTTCVSRTLKKCLRTAKITNEWYTISWWNRHMMFIILLPFSLLLFSFTAKRHSISILSIFSNVCLRRNKRNVYFSDNLPRRLRAPTTQPPTSPAPHDNSKAILSEKQKQRKKLSRHGNMINSANERRKTERKIFTLSKSLSVTCSCFVC